MIEPTTTEPTVEALASTLPYPTPSVPYWPSPCYAVTVEWCPVSDYDLHPVTIEPSIEAPVGGCCEGPEPTAAVVEVGTPPTLPATGLDSGALVGTSVIAAVALLAGIVLARAARRGPR